MHIEVTGRGPDLVLIHGWALQGGVFAPLPRRHHAAAPAVRGQRHCRGHAAGGEVRLVAGRAVRTACGRDAAEGARAGDDRGHPAFRARRGLATCGGTGGVRAVRA
ncbi:hypothetical protein G6F50_016975 [Rhizopus delemar]|uniref:Uncharacterized protein n=1 Tax=Rhizopus delemar TaxID=936053 RepID=A0A9P7C1F6_9FUNG|nr:hypothetical protein G6F50_016975 [Rhizopus delemar]